MSQLVTAIRILHLELSDLSHSMSWGALPIYSFNDHMMDKTSLSTPLPIGNEQWKHNFKTMKYMSKIKLNFNRLQIGKQRYLNFRPVLIGTDKVYSIANLKWTVSTFMWLDVSISSYSIDLQIKIGSRSVKVDLYYINDQEPDTRLLASYITLSNGTVHLTLTLGFH